MSVVGDGDGTMPESEDPAWFRHLAERSGDFFFRLRLSPVLGFEFLGDQVEGVIGFPPSQFLADPELAERLVVPEDATVLNALFTRTATGDVQTELRWTHLDGHTVWTQIWANRRIRPDGSMVLDGVARDVTALRTTQATIEAERRMYQMLTETMKDVVWVYDVDAAQFRYVSPSITSLSGVRTEDLLGQSIAVSTDPTTAAAFEALLERDRAVVGEARTGDFETIEFAQPRPDGSIVWTETTGHYVRSADTGHLELWAASRDISVRKHTRDQLAQSEQHFRLLAENSSDVVVQRDMTGRIVWVSPSVTSVLGWDPTAMVGQDTLEFVHPDDAALVQGMREGVATGERTDGLLIRTLHVDGRYRYVSVASHAVVDIFGNPTGAVIGLRDVDELVQATQRAERSEALLLATANARLVPQTLVEAVRDESGRIVDFSYRLVNRAAWTALGTTREQMLGSTLLTLAPGLVAPGLFAALADAVETGETLQLHDIPVVPSFGGPARRLDVSAVRVGDGLAIDWIDETERHEARQRLAESELRYRLLAENTLDVIVHYRDGLIAWVSPALTDALGWLPSQWEGSTIEEFLHPQDADAHAANGRILRAGKPVVARYRLRAATGAYHWIETHAKTFIDQAGTADGVVASFRTIDLEVRAEEELERRARYDDLTGLLKRDEAIARLSVRDGRRAPGVQRAVLFVDLDDFKTINDTYGHHTGDVVLRTLAQRIRAAVRDADPVARMGGDEFVVIVEGVHDLDAAEQVAEKVRAALAAPVRLGAVAIVATASIGVTILDPDEPADHVLARADRAMYQAKRSGRNRVLALARDSAAVATDGSAEAATYASE